MANAASAATFTVNGSDWEITATDVWVYNNFLQLSAQPWYDDPDLALQFAAVVGHSLGTQPVYTDLGVAFATDVHLLGQQSEAEFYAYSDTVGLTRFWLTDADYDCCTRGLFWAVATPISNVPLPAGGWLFLSSLAAVALFKQRKNQTL